MLRSDTLKRISVQSANGRYHADRFGIVDLIGIVFRIQSIQSAVLCMGHLLLSPLMSDHSPVNGAAGSRD